MALVAPAQSGFNLYEFLRRVVQKTQDGIPFGLICPIKFKVPIGAVGLATGDITKICSFPAGFYINRAAFLPPKLDSNVAPALVYDIALYDVNNNLQTTKIVAGSTNGQTGTAGDLIANTAVGLFVGNLYMAFRCVTGAATAAPGNLVCWIEVVYGIITDITTLPAGPAPYTGSY